MRLIDADYLICYIKMHGIGEATKHGQSDFLKAIEKQDIIESKSVVHGKWIEDNSNGFYDAECTKCGARIKWNGCDGDFNFCPECGSDMQKVV